MTQARQALQDRASLVQQEQRGHRDQQEVRLGQQAPLDRKDLQADHQALLALLAPVE